MEPHSNFTDSTKRQLASIVEGLEAQRAFLQDEIQASNEDKESESTLAAKHKRLNEVESELKQFKAKLDFASAMEAPNKEGLSSSGRLERPPIYYSDYLCLDTLLNSQKPESAKYGRPAHDEMLFIITHQTYELWFKQILHELTAVIQILNKDYVPEQQINRVTHHLARIIEIMKVLVAQVSILETMTPLDFMDFRDFLFPASGFQSYQFRLIENTLGMQPDKRVQYERKSYHTKLSAAHQTTVQEAEHLPNLFDVVQRWLERTPFLKQQEKHYDFLETYKHAVESMYEEDKKVIMKNTEKTAPEERERELKKLEDSRTSFRALFDQSAHDEQIKGGTKRLSFTATQAALLITIYQEEPVFSLPHKVLDHLIAIDELMTSWRYRHSLMVYRMIGSKIGTGGSSGYYYLKSTIERGRVFSDLANLATYLIPRKDLPELPSSIRKEIAFFFEHDH